MDIDATSCAHSAATIQYSTMYMETIGQCYSGLSRNRKENYCMVYSWLGLQVKV